MLSPIRRDPPGSMSLTPLNPGIDRIPTPVSQRDAARARADVAPRCLYIKPSGERCGSPAMRGLDLCYYHDRYQPKPGYRNLPCLEDPHSVQCAIQEIIEDMLNGLLDYKKAALALYGLQTAASNLKQMRIAEEKARSVQRSACSEEQMNTGRTQGTRRDWESSTVDTPPWTEEDAVPVAAAQGSRAATHGFSPARSAGYGDEIPDQSRRDDWSVSGEDDIEEIELVAGCDNDQESAASNASSCVHSPLPTADSQRPTTAFVESPRQPQHVTFGLTSAEKKRMKEVFPDMKKIREEYLSMLTPEERAEVEQRREA